MRFTAVAETQSGDRVEMTLSFPDSYATALPIGEAEKRLRLILQTEVDRSAVILYVAEKDRKEAGLVHVDARGPKVKPKKITNPGPDQIAFVGTDEAHEIHPDGKIVAVTGGGERRTVQAARSEQASAPTRASKKGGRK